MGQKPDLLTKYNEKLIFEKLLKYSRFWPIVKDETFQIYFLSYFQSLWAKMIEVWWKIVFKVGHFVLEITSSFHYGPIS
jgi:hypothetical protein